jgi:hypothetical protein
MSNKFKFWLNVDKPAKQVTLHESDCVHVLNKQETEFKGVEEDKRDGGWHGFDSREEAENWYASNYIGFGLIPCAGCF